MSKLCIYSLENGATPSWIVDGGYFAHGSVLVGVAVDHPPHINAITLWDLIAHVINLDIVDIEGTVTSEQDKIIIAKYFYIEKIGNITAVDLKPQQSKLLDEADKKIIRYNEQVELGLTPTDANIEYMSFSGDIYTGKEAILWYKQDIRDIENHQTVNENIVWPQLTESED